MQIVTVRDLPRALTASWGALLWSDNDAPQDQAQFERARALGVPMTEYGGLLAVDGGEVLAQVRVERFSLTTPQGVETFAAVEDVVTRSDFLRHGLCARLLRELHRREAKNGQRLAMLWTRRTWGAHRLYEKLGYRDLYSPPIAILPPRGSAHPRLSPGFALRRACRADLPVLESLLAHGTRGRYGFVPRFRGSFRARVGLGWRTAREHHLLVRGSRPVGYFYAVENRRQVGVYEGLVTEPSLLPTLIDSMRHLAKGRWLTLGHTTLVNDAIESLREREFSVYPTSHTTLMARSLDHSPSARILELRRLVSHPRFSCHRGDMF